MVITKIEQQRRDPNRVSLYVGDGTFLMGIAREVLEHAGLRLGSEVTPDLLRKLEDDEDRSRAMNRALALLAHRGRAIQEVRSRLRRFGHDEAVITDIVERLVELRYLDDYAFAFAYARDRLGAGKPRGRRAILMDLKAKGVAEGIAERALDEATEASSETPEERVLRAAERWARRKTASEDPKRLKSKLWAYLARRGFDGSLIRGAIAEVLG